MTVPTQFWNGQPAIVQNNLPTSHNIASTTNATPIVVTTSTNHGLTTGDVVKIAGATDPNANGDFIASVLSLTTFSLLAFPAGTSVAGTLAGGAAGAVLSYSFGVTYPLPSDLTDDMDAASVNVALEALGDWAAWLKYNKVNRFGDTMGSGATLFFPTGTTLDNQSGSIVAERGRRVRGVRTVLTDANHTIGVASSGAVIGGNRFELSSTPGAVRTITIDDVTVPPLANETIEVLVPGPLATGQSYILKRLSGVTVAEYWGNANGDAGAWAEYEYVGGVWRLGANGGGGADGGVLSGTGA